MTKTTTSKRELFRQEPLDVEGGAIPLTLWKTSLNVTDEPIQDSYILEVDGVEWFKTSSMMHAAVLFELMHDHLTEYMHYELNA